MSDNHRNGDDATRGLVWRVVLGAFAGLVTLAAVLYAAFWLPFGEPTDALPRAVRILPLERAADGVDAEDESERFAWVDREAGIVRIPTAEAMELVVETLPVRKEAATNAERERRRLAIPTDAGSGRFVPRHDER